MFSRRRWSKCFDVVYTLDALNRVIGADEGNKSGATIEGGYRTRNELWNSLSVSGNWKNRQVAPT